MHVLPCIDVIMKCAFMHTVNHGMLKYASSCDVSYISASKLFLMKLPYAKGGAETARCTLV